MGGMWHLDIPKCQDRDGGKIEVIARNQCGEAYATTTLSVKRRRDDYRSVLKHNVKRDYINSKEYRKPDWLIAMEALKEKLAATEQAAKFIREIKEVRNKEGMRARFEAVFAGNPKPEVNWYFQGKLLEESTNIQIKIREDTTSLTVMECKQEHNGYYECKIINDLGEDKTRASLTVSRVTEADKEAIEKQRQAALKRDQEKDAQLEAAKKPAPKKVEEKKEEKKTYDWKKSVKKVEKKETAEQPKPEKVQLKKPKVVDK